MCVPLNLWLCMHRCNLDKGHTSPPGLSFGTWLVSVFGGRFYQSSSPLLQWSQLRKRLPAKTPRYYSRPENPARLCSVMTIFLLGSVRQEWLPLLLLSSWSHSDCILRNDKKCTFTLWWMVLLLLSLKEYEGHISAHQLSFYRPLNSIQWRGKSAVMMEEKLATFLESISEHEWLDVISLHDTLKSFLQVFYVLKSRGNGKLLSFQHFDWLRV